MPRRVSHRFIHAGHRATVEDHAWGARIDQTAHAVLSARGQDVSSTDDVGLVVPAIGAPNTGLCRDVKHDVAPGAGLSNDARVGDITPEHAHTRFDQFRIGASRETTHPVASSQQLFDNRPPNEATAPGHQRGD